MTKNLPAVIKPPRVKAAINDRHKQPPDMIICLILALGIVALMARPLGDAGVGTWFWGIYCVLNLIYVLYGLHTKTLTGGASWGMLIMLGPITFYFFTIVGAWRKYYKYKKGGYGWTIQKLEKELINNDLSQGFDFEFPYEHLRRVMSLLKSCRLVVEDVLDKDWVLATKSPWCLSITDTRINMNAREERR